VTKEKEEEHCL